MPIKTRYLFTAAMDVEPDKDAIFNEIYDKEHVPSLLEVPASSPSRASSGASWSCSSAASARRS